LVAVGELTLASRVGEVRVIDEGWYRVGSVDNARCYANVLDLAGEYEPSSVHGIIIDGVPLTIIRTAGGATCVHPHSALIAWDCLFLAVGDVVARFSLSPPELQGWAKADTATCFGLHYSSGHEALICHGELEISRIAPDGRILWQQGGRDIFTGEFVLRADFIEAHDWDNRPYRFRYDTGTPP
jgi:hypothetical protein